MFQKVLDIIIVAFAQVKKVLNIFANVLMPIFRALAAGLSAIADFLEYIGLSLGALGTLLGDLFGINDLLKNIMNMLSEIFSFDLNLCSLVKTISP